jgi:pimeloyl-ACP methyl ester carboxylesterase
MIPSAAGLRQTAVAVQLAGALGCAGLLVNLADWSWYAALAGGIVVVLVLFALSVALAFAITLSGVGTGGALALPATAQALRRSTPPLGVRRALACYARECHAVFRMFNWLQPFRSDLRVAASPAGPVNEDRPPLLLVHGYGCNHAVWLDMLPALAAAGYRCEAIDLEPVLGDIDDYGRALLARMAAIHQTEGRAPLLLCHSMGGLAARAALAHARRDGVAAPHAGIVTLGTPHRGCALARYGSGINATQMRCTSAWLRSLAEAETAQERAGIVSVFSWHDSIAGPPGTAWLDGARHIALSGIGHVSLLRDPIAARAAIDALDDLATQAPAHAIVD